MVLGECVCSRDGNVDQSEAMGNGFGYEIGNNNVAKGNSGEGLQTYKRQKHAKPNSGTKVQEDGRRVCTESHLPDQVLQTYKRRKHAKPNSGTKVQEDGRVCTESQLPDQTVKEQPCIVVQNSPFKQTSILRKDCQDAGNGSDDSPYSHWRNLVLENIYQSVSESEGGIQGCVCEALVFQAQNGCSDNKVSFDKYRHKYPTQAGTKLNVSPNIAEGTVGVTFDASLSESNYHTITERCRRAFFNIIVSEKFAALCKLLGENFQGIKVDSFFDYSIVNKRMKEGEYEYSPKLFSADIQQVWRNLRKIGTEMVSLAESLSDISSSSYCEQVGGSMQDISDDGKYEFHDRAADCQTKPEQLETSAGHKICSCSRCAEKVDGRDCLVCDSCEEMFHVSCIEPAVKEIPPGSWYCARCTANGFGSPHENCVVCERRIVTNGGGGDDTNSTLAIKNDTISTLTEKNDTNSTENQMSVELEQDINCSTEDELWQAEGSENSCRCKICGSETKIGENFWECEHVYCPFKYYHVRCLTIKQLKLYGPRWYCPSCLCRVCFTDRDDDRIVLCDACDHAYHIDCMQPPLTSIPSGKWFCRECDEGIQEIHKAKRVYEILGKNLNKDNDGYENFRKKQKKNGEEELDKAAGVDMLLNAANTLKFEEKVAAIRTKR